MCTITFFDIINTICNGILAIASFSALVLGLFYFNKRLKFYLFVENSQLKIIAFDKGNGSCKISKAFYRLKNNKTEIKNIERNQISIDLTIIENFKVLSIEILDNYGRKYKLKHRRGRR